MLLTLPGIVTAVKFAMSAKAPAPMMLTVAPSMFAGMSTDQGGPE
jgi:hypothetical protein